MKTIAICWYWKEWMACERYFRELGLDVKIFDKVFNNLDNFDLIVKSPWISRHNNPEFSAIFKKWKLTSWSQIFLDNCKGKVIGITWTKWKSTVSGLIFNILVNSGIDAELVWNWGYPALDYIKSKAKIFIFELSSYQIEDLRGPLLDTWVIINLFPDHLDYHWWFEQYQNAKENIYSISQEVIDTRYIQLPDFDVDYSKFKLKWTHNHNNLNLAIKVAKKYWATQAWIQATINTFAPLPHRLNEIMALDRLWIDDSISTTPESSMEAIKVYKDSLSWIILWGLNRGYCYNSICAMLNQIPSLKAIALLPDTQDIIEKLIDKKITILKSQDMKEIVKFLALNSSSGWTILLSTAAPSYNLYKNFEEQSEDFINSINNLTNEQHIW